MLAQVAGFVFGGGLLALVQAVLSFVQSQKATQTGADHATVIANTAVAKQVVEAKQVTNAVAVEPDAGVIGELRNSYSRD